MNAIRPFLVPTALAIVLGVCFFVFSLKNQFTGINNFGLGFGLKKSKSNYSKLKELFRRMKGMDDAKAVLCVALREIFNGTQDIAFAHARFFPSILEKYNRFDLLEKANFIAALSEYRNVLLIKALNKEYEKINANGGYVKADGTIAMLHIRDTSTMEHIVSPENKASLVSRAKALGVNPTRYLEPDLTDDISSCLTDFCLGDLKTKVFKAADAVIIVQDLDGELYCLFIKRGFGPHRGSVAFPGGFNEIKNGKVENMRTSAWRELKEEVGGVNVLDNTQYFSQDEGLLETFLGMTWDARHQFGLYGTENGGGYLFIKILQCLPDEWEEK